MSWNHVNRALVAKALAELSFEQLLSPSEHGDRYRVELASGVAYDFVAWKSVWDYLRVAPASVRRFPDAEICAGQFFVDAQNETGMTDIVLGNFLEEMHNTLHADLTLLKKQRPVEEMTEWSGERLQTVLNGHPKILLNKGRIGWGVKDAQTYAPENEKAFRLHWLALFNENAVAGIAQGFSTLGECFSPAEQARLRADFPLFSEEKYFLLPVHPWQWDRVVQTQFLEALTTGTLLSLGLYGDEYQPQISLRTLANRSRPERADIKLPLTILNTSAIRGIPSRYLESAPAVSVALEKICRGDTILARTEVLKEKAGVGYSHPLFAQVKGAPYRYHEQLAAVWRESTQGKLGEGEQAILTGSLFHQDPRGGSYLGALARKSGLTLASWLERYFEEAVIPLYHLQRKYGLGLVAHGQNVVLRLKNHAPTGLFLKDFQGDLRLSSESSLGGEAWTKNLDRLPPHYLIHDLITGHFSTVLRFVSAALEESEGFSEREFYGILSACVRRYNESEGPAPAAQEILAPKIARVLLNKVRFKIGYADSAERPLPLTGEDLENPLWSKNETV